MYFISSCGLLVYLLDLRLPVVKWHYKRRISNLDGSSTSRHLVLVPLAGPQRDSKQLRPSRFSPSTPLPPLPFLPPLPLLPRFANIAGFLLQPPLRLWCLIKSFSQTTQNRGDRPTRRLSVFTARRNRWLAVAIARRAGPPVDRPSVRPSVWQ